MGIKDLGLYKSVRNCYYTIKNWDEIQDKKKLKKGIEKYHNINKDESCVIIGNGPSLKVEDLSKLYKLGIKTFACNRIFMAFDQTDWRPTYYFISDEKLLEGYPDDIDGVPAENRFFPETFRDRIRNGMFYLKDPELRDYEKEGRFSLDASDGLYGGASVTTEMIQMAYYMGFSEIYLIGVDFSYAVNNPLNGRTYEYNGEDNYFVKGYLKKGEVADTPNITANLLAFNVARDTLKKEGVIIKNATRGGKLEVFDRIDLDTLFDIWEKK